MITIGMTGLESEHNQQRRKYQSMTRFKNDDNRIVVLNQNTTNGENPNLYWQSKSIDGGNRNINKEQWQKGTMNNFINVLWEIMKLQATFQVLKQNPFSLFSNTLFQIISLKFFD